MGDRRDRSPLYCNNIKASPLFFAIRGGMCGVFLGELEDIDGEMFLQPIELAHVEKQRLFREIGYLLPRKALWT